MIRCSNPVTHSTLVGTVEVMSHVGAFLCECIDEYDRTHLPPNNENTRTYPINVKASFPCLSRALQCRSTLASLTILHRVAHGTCHRYKPKSIVRKNGMASFMTFVANSRSECVTRRDQEFGSTLPEGSSVRRDECVHVGLFLKAGECICLNDCNRDSEMDMFPTRKPCSTPIFVVCMQIDSAGRSRCTFNRSSTPAS